MSILGPFDRPVAFDVRVGGWPPPPRPVTSPPIPPPEAGDGRSVTPRPSLGRARFLATTLLGTAHAAASAVPELEAVLAEDVVTWSPSMYTTSRTDLVAALLDGDDAVDEIEVTIADECLTRTGAHVTWRVSGRFGNAGFLNDDVLVEPSHRRVESAGVLVCSFAGALIDRIECYHDCLALYEQVLPGRR